MKTIIFAVTLVSFFVIGCVRIFHADRLIGDFYLNNGLNNDIIIVRKISPLRICIGQVMVRSMSLLAPGRMITRMERSCLMDLFFMMKGDQQIFRMEFGPQGLM
jgi:hypothetical protein